jgi:YidC/Oxa1 family membrane protein insertase
MAYLKNLIFNVLLIAQPTGVWETIIFAFTAGIANYAWAIIVLTLLIKLVMLPFDFFNKKFMRKNTKMQALIKPELDVIKKKYGNDQKLINQKTLELYKKHNYNMGGSCLFMFIN